MSPFLLLLNRLTQSGSRHVRRPGIWLDGWLWSDYPEEIFGILPLEVIKRDFWVISHFPGNRDRSLKYAIHDRDTWHAKSSLLSSFCADEGTQRSVQTIQFDCNWVICYPCVASKRLLLTLAFQRPCPVRLSVCTCPIILWPRTMTITSIRIDDCRSCHSSSSSPAAAAQPATCSTGMNNDDGGERSFASSCRLERCFPSFNAQSLSGWVFGGGGNKNVKNRKNLRRGRGIGAFVFGEAMKSLHSAWVCHEIFH